MPVTCAETDSACLHRWNDKKFDNFSDENKLAKLQKMCKPDKQIEKVVGPKYMT